MHYNIEAANVLSYPKKPEDVPSLEAILPSARFHLADLGRRSSPSVIGFTSGRRRYHCRVFMLDAGDQSASRSQPRVLVMLERESSHAADIAHWSDEFQLTHRERETVEHLLRGLTSKEIAQVMGISPHTVKSFLRLVMTKVGTSTRAGLVAKIFDKAS
jgi:DNA-binding CsgD family transcriptional regulator